MTEKIKIDLGSIQRTLFLPLWGRAQETAKADPMLVDHKAVEVIEKVDFDFSPLAEKMSALTQIAWIQRCTLVDEAIRQFLQVHPRGTVVNIGCGLDTTFSRVDNGSLLWYDLDLPDAIALRRQFIPETDRAKMLASSFLEEGWLDEISVRDGVFFMSCGVFYYFSEAEIKKFLIRLADKFPGCEIIFDVCSPMGVKTANRMVLKNAGMDESSYLTWGLAHTRDILAWDERFGILNTLYYFKDSRIKPNVRFAGWISNLMKIQYILHFRLGK